MHICTRCNLENVTVMHAGCSEKSGVLVLAVPGDKASSPGASFEAAVAEREQCRLIKVPVITLDDYFKNEERKIAAIKIDVEGHELAVLRGSTQLIQKHKPIIVCECEQRHMSVGTVQMVLDYVLALGYEGYFSNNEMRVPLRDFDVQKHQKQWARDFGMRKITSIILFFIP